MSQGMKGDVSSAEFSVQPWIMAQFFKKYGFSLKIFTTQRERILQLRRMN